MPLPWGILVGGDYTSGGDRRLTFEPVATRGNQGAINMIRKMLVVAAAAAMPITAIAATGGFAAAAAPKIDATHYTVSCTKITATAKFTPALSTAGAPVSNQATAIKGSASGCTATPSAGGAAVTVVSAAISGTINDASSNHQCTGLLTPTTETGSLTIKWKTTQKLVSGTSVVNPGTVTGGAGGDGHATFTLGFNAATSGPFQGTDSGVSSSTDAETTTTVGAINGLCGGKKGLKSIAIVQDTNVGAQPALVSQ
jgi:hypothetical protein